MTIQSAMPDSLVSRRIKWAIVALLAGHAVLGLDAARRLTVTHDEYWHLPAGLLAWRTGRFDFDHLNPPLTRMWGAVPLLFTGARLDSTRIQPGDLFALGRQFLDENRATYERDLALARSANVLWSVLTGAILAVWAARLFGGPSALLTTALWAFCPNAIANAALITPDAGGACLFVATLYAAWSWGTRPGWRPAATTGLLLGAAQLAKFTNLLLVPLAVLVWLLASRDVISARPAGPSESKFNVPPVRRRIGELLVAGLVSLVVLNAGFLFRGSFTDLGSYAFQSRSMKGLVASAGPALKLPVPLPRDYLAGLDHQRAIMESQHPVYLDGVWSLEGFPDYYLKTLEYKLPHVTQLLIGLAILFVLLPGREPRLLRTQCILLVPVLLILGVASSMGMQLGMRYVLPALPLLFLFAGQVARWFDWRTYRWRALATLLAALALPCSVRFHPHHLAYFNEWAGGPLGGRAHLLDSNLDWGQDLRGLKAWLDERQLDEIGLAYFGMFPPSELGIRYHVPTREPVPGWYAVSVNFLNGRPHTVFNPDGTFRPADFQEFSWLQLFPPEAHIGYSIDVFHVTEQDLHRIRRPANVFSR